MVAAFSLRMETISRGAQMQRAGLGPAIAKWLKVPAVVEVVLHPDGRLWVDRPTEGLADGGDCPPQTASWRSFHRKRRLPDDRPPPASASTRTAVPEFFRRRS
jgi:hypothetical protein